MFNNVIDWFKRTFRCAAASDATATSPVTTPTPHPVVHDTVAETKIKKARKPAVSSDVKNPNTVKKPRVTKPRVTKADSNT